MWCQVRVWEAGVVARRVDEGGEDREAQVVMAQVGWVMCTVSPNLPWPGEKVDMIFFFFR